MTAMAGRATPAVSIIITCYNYESYVGQAIESALAQTFTDVEVIVVDDGSKDGSAAVISRYADQVQSIRRENGGSIKACQTGLSKASGRFIMFLDADDVLKPEALVEVSPFLTDNVSKIQFKLQPIDAAGANIGTPFPHSVEGFGSQQLIAEITKRGCYDTPPTSGNIYRRDVYTQLGSIEYDYGIDGVAYLLAPFIGDVVFVQKALGLYRLHGRNMSGAGMMRPARLFRDGDVFIERLNHLARILCNKNIKFDRKITQNRYQYSLERIVLGRIIRGENVAVKDRLAYLKSIMDERGGAQRVKYLIFGILAVFAPRRAALKLIEFRNDPAARPLLRTLITRH